MNARRQLAAASFLGLAALACCLGGRIWAQQGKADGTQPKAGPRPLYFGVSACVRCHSLKNASDAVGLPPVLCRCNEVLIWKDQDKHKLAYTNIDKPNGLGQQMIKLLGYSTKEVEKNCVVCHGVYIPDDKLATMTDGSFKRDQSDGVTCVACHGAYRDWVTKHGSDLEDDRKEWRTFSRTEKEVRFGMSDLWDSGRRTRKCATCHIGNSDEGKAVTHAMYAVGHPPLPGLEVGNFSEVMPKHWQYLREKKEPAQKLLDFKPGELEATKLVLVGGAVNLQEAMNLLASQADLRAKEKDPNLQGLDFAHYDCYACHHDLKSDSWRQKRGYTGIPGRPQLRPWPLALARLGVRHLGEPELDKKLAELEAVFNKQPFGRPEEVQVAAGNLAAWAGELAKRLNESKKFDRAAATRLLQELGELAQSDANDYDSARQIAWAYFTIYKELNANNGDSSGFKMNWKTLNTELGLDLPASQTQDIEKALPRSLQLLNNFDPRQFKKTFESLSKVSARAP